MLRSRISALLIGVSVLSAPSAHGQTDDARPYDSDLARLSEVIGAVHYLRELCGSEEGQIWREQMEAIISSEGYTPRRRIDLIKSFNKGYLSYRRTYRTCTSSAQTAIAKFLTEGGDLSNKLLETNKKVTN